MFQNNVEALNMARAMMSHAGARQGVIARNMAHADTPGFRAADLPDFTEIYRKGATLALRKTRAAHLSGGSATAVPARPAMGEAAPNGNSVSLEREMVRAAEARHQHDMGLAIYRSLSGVIRTSLGRGR